MDQLRWNFISLPTTTSNIFSTQSPRLHNDGVGVQRSRDREQTCSLELVINYCHKQTCHILAKLDVSPQLALLKLLAHLSSLSISLLLGTSPSSLISRFLFDPLHNFSEHSSTSKLTLSNITSNEMWKLSRKFSRYCFLQLNIESESKASHQRLKQRIFSQFNPPEAKEPQTAGVPLLRNMPASPFDLNILTTKLTEIAQYASPFHIFFEQPFRFPAADSTDLVKQSVSRGIRVCYNIGSPEYNTMREDVFTGLGDVSTHRAPAHKTGGRALPLKIIHPLKLDRSAQPACGRVGLVSGLSDDVATNILEHLQQSSAGKDLDPLLIDGFSIIFQSNEHEKRAGIQPPPPIFIPFLGQKRLDPSRKPSASAGLEQEQGSRTADISPIRYYRY